MYYIHNSIGICMCLSGTYSEPDWNMENIRRYIYGQP